MKTVLESGYFPEEWPPTFSTRTLSLYYDANAANLPVAVTQDNDWTRMLSHSLGRHAHYRRTLGIPHPKWFIRVSRALASQWPLLESKLNSKLSLSTPSFNPLDHRAISPRERFPELASRRAKAQSITRYVARTDLSRYYSSVYTHSIPWAIHTKAVAKANQKNYALVGNEIDRCIRSAQDGQTMGIPISPDTSLVVSELILGEIDRLIQPKMKKAVGFRHMDDFEFYTKSLAQAEDLVNILQESLAKYELAINPRKTFTDEAPAALEAPWLLELRRMATSSDLDIISYADRALELWREFPDQHVLGFAHGVVENSPAEWERLQPILLLFSSVDGATLRATVRACAGAVGARKRVDRRHLEAFLNEVIRKHAERGHHNEVAWALWGCMTLGIRVHSGTSRAIEALEDPVVALLALDAHSRGLVRSLNHPRNWLDCMNVDALSGPQWLLAYEASLKNWLPRPGGVDFVATDPFFSSLRNGGVSFYDPNGIAVMPRRQRVSGSNRYS